LILMADLALITRADDAESRVERFFRSSPDLGAATMILLESFRARYAYLLVRRGGTSRVPELMEEAAKVAQDALRQGNEMPRVRLEMAALYAARRQKEPALEWLQQAYNAGCRDPRTLVRDPMFESLRNEPRFKDLLDRMNKDIAAMRSRSGT
jgi:hypothetical protein